MRSFNLASSSASASARAALSRACGGSATTASSIATRRTYTTLPQLRPSILSTPKTVFRSSNILSRLPAPTTTTTTTTVNACGEPTTEILDLVPKTAITSHPALAGAAQVRCGPRPTMARSSRLVRKRRHGFLSRVRTRNGRRTLQRRRTKQRSVLSM